MIKVPYLLQAPVKGVKLLDGRFLRAFNNNIAFLKRFDIDRMLYWFRVNAGVPAPGAPYARWYKPAMARGSAATLNRPRPSE